MHVIINGVSSETLQGVQVLSLPPITKPRMRTSVAVIDGRPGDIVTRLGYEAYNRKIRILLHHDYDIDEISAFFNTSGKIIFSNEPDMEYEFETIDAFSFERAVRYKTADITFHVQPYKLSATEEPATGEVSTLVDKTPYIIRRTPFGTRQKGTIVGGSIVWNQLIENGDFADGSSKWVANSGSVTYADGKATFTVTSAVATNAFRQTKETIEGHVYLASMTITPSKATTAAFYIGNSVVGTKAVAASRTTVSVVHKAANNGTYIYYYINRKTELAANDTCVFENMQAFDLTLTLGPTIADYIYAQEQASALAKAWAGITADYYPYDAGTIKSVEGLTSHKTTGFNQWDEEWENGAYASGSGTKGTNANKVRNKNPIPILPNTEYYIETPLSGTNVYQYDADMNYIQKTVLEVAQGNTFTSLPNACYMNFSTFGSDYKVYNNDICINISDPAKNGTYEPYTVYEYSLDSSITLPGLPKLDGDNLYYDGDVYEGNKAGTITVGKTDMGTLNWVKDGQVFYATVADKLNTEANFIEIDSRYTCLVSNAVNLTAARSALTGDKYAMASNGSSKPYVYVRDDSCADVASFVEAVSGITLHYALATPVTQTSGGMLKRRYRLTDLGTINWSKDNQTNNPGRFYSSGIASLVRRPTAAAQYGAFILCSKYIAGRNPISTPKDADKMIAIYTNGTIYLSDITYTESTAAEFKAAMSGVYLLYETAELYTETAEPYTELQICDPNGTEEWVGASMPVGHDTTYIDPISMTVNNEGNTESAPSITIEGEGAVEVTVDGLNILRIQMPSSGEITINSRTLDATDGEGGLANRSVTGDYNDLQLAPGEHTVTVTGDVTSVTIKNTSRWI